MSEYPTLTKRVYNALYRGLPETAPPYFWKKLYLVEEWGTSDTYAEIMDLKGRRENPDRYTTLCNTAKPGGWGAIEGATKAMAAGKTPYSSFTDFHKHIAMRLMIWTLHEMEARPEEWGILGRENDPDPPSLLRHERLRVYLCGGDVARKLSTYKSDQCRYALGHLDKPPDPPLTLQDLDYALSVTYRLTHTHPFWKESIP